MFEPEPLSLIVMNKHADDLLAAHQEEINEFALREALDHHELPDEMSLVEEELMNDLLLSSY